MPPFLHGIKLTETQQDKIFDILHNQAKNLREAMKSLSKAESALATLGTSPAYEDAKARALVDTKVKALAELSLLRVRTEHQIFELLTPEQRKQVEAMPPPCAGEDRDEPPRSNETKGPGSSFPRW